MGTSQQLEQLLEEKINQIRIEDKIKRRKKTLIWIIIILIILSVGSCSLYGFLNEPPKSRLDRDADALAGFLPGKTQEEIDKELNRIVAEGQFNVSINPQIRMKTGSSPANVSIENVQANKYLMKVKISLQETNEVIYTSGLISPGYYVKEAKFNRSLPKGVYYGVATFYAHDPETEEEIGSTAVTLEIKVDG